MTDNLNREELRRIFDAALRLHIEGKLTKDGVWEEKGNFLTHLPDCIKADEATTGSINFQKVSSGVDAAAQIYAERVELTYKFTYQTLQQYHGVAVAASAGDAEDGDVATDQGPAAVGKRQRRQPEAVDPKSTLQTADQLRNKKISMTFDNDPLFRRTTQLFDENSASGLLLLNYPVGDRCHIAFDGAARLPLQCCTNLESVSRPGSKVELQGWAAKIACALVQTRPKLMTPALGELLQLTRSSQQGPQLKLDNAAMLKACMPAAPVAPASVPDAPMEDPSQGPSGSKGPASAHGVDMDMDMDTDGDQSMGSNGSGAAGAGQAALGGGAPWLEGEVDLGPALDYGPEDGPAGGAGDWADMSDDQQDGASEAGSPKGPTGSQAFQFDSFGMAPGQSSSGTLPSKSTNWAGTNHWRYKASTKTTGTRKAAAKPKRKQHSALDLSGPGVDPRTIACVEHKAISVNKRVLPVTLLPRDTHYQEGQLHTLFIRPELPPIHFWEAEIRAQRARPTTAAADRHRSRMHQQGPEAGQGGDGDGTEGGVQAWGADWGGAEDTAQAHLFQDDDQDGADGNQGWDGGDPSDVLEPVGQAATQFASHLLNPLSLEGLSLHKLLYEPRKASALQVPADNRQQVDVKALKECIKGQVMKQREEQASPGGAEITFGKVMQALPSQDIGRNVSVHLAFICLLHLANENGLALGNAGMLDRLNIRVPPHV